MAKNPVKLAAHAFSDFNFFASVESLMESGLIYSQDSQEAANTIVDICKREKCRLLNNYDDLEKQCNEHPVMSTNDIYKYIL